MLMLTCMLPPLSMEISLRKEVIQNMNDCDEPMSGEVADC